MRTDTLSTRFVSAWAYGLASAYTDGLIPNHASLLALLYAELQASASRDEHVLLAPQMVFPPHSGILFESLSEYQAKVWLGNHRPDLLLVKGGEVLAVATFGFSPDEYADFRRPMRVLVEMRRLAGRGQVYLDFDPLAGSLRMERPCAISEGLLAVYGVITREGAQALRSSELRREYGADTFPAPFLHLGGAILPDRAHFSHTLLY